MATHAKKMEKNEAVNAVVAACESLVKGQKS
jgi:hypothetical protein